MFRPTSRQVGTAGLVIRYRDGTSAFTCRRCQAWTDALRWRTALRLARSHACDHAGGYPTDRYALTPTGSTHLGRPPRRPLRRLAIVVVVLVVAALAFMFTVAGLASRASSAPATSTTTPTTPTTPTAAAAAAAAAGYVPTVAGPPATDPCGQWIPGPAPAPASPNSSTGAEGGGR